MNKFVLIFSEQLIPNFKIKRITTKSRVMLVHGDDYAAYAAAKAFVVACEAQMAAGTM